MSKSNVKMLPPSNGSLLEDSVDNEGRDQTEMQLNSLMLQASIATAEAIDDKLAVKVGAFINSIAGLQRTYRLIRKLKSAP